MDLVRQCVVLLGQPTHPQHVAACAQLEAWEADRLDELCSALGQMVLCGSETEGFRQLAAIALKNAISRRWPKAAGEAVKEIALRSLGDSSALVRSGGAALVEAAFVAESDSSNSDSSWPERSLRAMCDGKDPTVIDGALRAIDAIASVWNGDDDEEGTKYGGQRHRWPRDYALVASLAQLLRRPEMHNIRLRALRCARLVGWVDREENSSAVTECLARLSTEETGQDASLAEEILVALRQLMSRLVADDKKSVEALAVAEHALASLEHPDPRVALRAAEFWHAAAKRGCHPSTTQLLPKLVPTLVRAMRYTEQDIAGFNSSTRRNHIDVPDSTSLPVAAAVDGDEYDDDDYDDVEGGSSEDEDDFFFEDDEEGGYWTLRKCTAATLDALARHYGSALLEVALPHIAQGLEPEEKTDVWTREAALLGLGAISDGCRMGLRPHAPTVAPFLLAQLSDNPIPQIREMAAWVASRAAKSWLVSDDEVFSSYVQTLLGVLLRDNNKRVLESATSAASALFLANTNGCLEPYARVAAAVLGVSIGRFQLRARLQVYDAIGSLTSSGVALDDEAKLAVLGPLDARWDEHDAVGDDGYDDEAAWPILECIRAIARTEQRQTTNGEISSIYTKATHRCVRIVERSAQALLDGEVSLDEARAAAGVGSFALDVIGAFCVPLGGNVHAVVGEVVETSLRLLPSEGISQDNDGGDKEESTVTSLRNPHRRRGEDTYRHREARGVHKSALASAAAILLGQVVSVSPTDATQLIADRGASLLYAISVPLTVGTGRPVTNLERAVDMASQNAAWIVGQLAVGVDSEACNTLLPFFTDACQILATLVAREQKSTVASHAALVLGRCFSRPELSHVAIPHVVSRLVPWLTTLASMHRGADSKEVARCFTALSSTVARTTHLLDALAEPTAAVAFVTALAAWRRYDPPTPPPTLALSLKRLLYDLRARGSLQLLQAPSSDSGTATVLHQGDAEYLSRLYD